MMLIYLPVNFELDWTNYFELESKNEKCGAQTDVVHINLRGGLVTRNPLKNYDAHLQPLSNVPTNYQLEKIYGFRDIVWTKF